MKGRILKSALFILSAILLSPSCEDPGQNTENIWQQVGSPQGLRVNQFSFNSQGDIFICTWWHPDESGNGGAIHRIERSADNGNSWASILEAGWTPVCANIDAADNIYAGTWGKVYRSSDNGESWETVIDTLPVSAIHTIDISPEGHIYIGANHGNYRSEDNGTHWEALTLEYQAKAFLFLGNGDILAGVNSGYFPNPPQYIYRSNDGGNSWVKVLTANYTYYWSMAANQNGTVFAATSEYDSTAGGVYRSTDNGLHWTRVNNGLPSRDVNSLVVNSLGHVFIGIYGHSVYRSIDDGETWNDISDGLTDLRIKSLGMSRDDILYVGTGTSGLPTSETEDAHIFQTMTVTSVH